uniref:Uncharacterized protein n=1 Tax=Trypanosoma congolense (strain IL3000) TaxID=1068625 RepID=G0UM94_TRYCI|nr:hypothetical protein, unlikely [Trypanosoma congolense IL3000]
MYFYVWGDDYTFVIFPLLLIQVHFCQPTMCYSIVGWFDRPYCVAACTNKVKCWMNKTVYPAWRDSLLLGDFWLCCALILSFFCYFCFIASTTALFFLPC